MRYFIQQSISQKPPVGQIDKDLPICLPQGWYPEQMLDQHHLYEHYRISPGSSIVVAIVWLQSFIQPFIVHDLIHFSQQMIFRNQRFYICYHRFFPCVPSPLLHTEHPPLLVLSFYQMWGCLNSFLTHCIAPALLTECRGDVVKWANAVGAAGSFWALRCFQPMHRCSFGHRPVFLIKNATSSCEIWSRCAILENVFKDRL